jgi:hypothetical protein
MDAYADALVGNPSAYNAACIATSDLDGPALLAALAPVPESDRARVLSGALYKHKFIRACCEDKGGDFVLLVLTLLGTESAYACGYANEYVEHNKITRIITPLGAVLSGSGNVRVVEALLRAGANPDDDCVSEAGGYYMPLTPLQFVFMCAGCRDAGTTVDVVRALLRAGANQEIKIPYSLRFHSPINLAFEARNEVAARVLLAHGAVVDGDSHYWMNWRRRCVCTGY